MSLKKIALVTCSTRSPRLNPFIAQYINRVLEGSGSPHLVLEVVDIQDQSLPLFDEAKVPSSLPEADPTPHYIHEYTRVWSAKIRGYDGFIFVIPQYNWSIPASLKNALDYLFYEWKGKPAAIVSYGGRGGGKAADHLRDVLGDLRMKAIVTSPAIVIKVAMAQESTETGRLDETYCEEWKKVGVEEQIHKMFAELSSELIVDAAKI